MNRSTINLVFYHAKVTCKPARAKEVALVGYEYDLSREDTQTMLLMSSAAAACNLHLTGCGAFPNKYIVFGAGPTERSSALSARFIIGLSK